MRLIFQICFCKIYDKKDLLKTSNEVKLIENVHHPTVKIFIKRIRELKSAWHLHIIFISNEKRPTFQCKRQPRIIILINR